MPDINSGALRATFDDNFDAFSWDRGGTAGGTWNTQYHWGRTIAGHRELEYYSDASVGVNPFRIEDGALVITASPSADPSKTGGLPYTSGVITTQGNFAQQYGYFEMRADLPQGKGLWSAFWMLTEGLSHPPELDVMEVIGSKSDVNATLHSSANGYKQWYDWEPAPGLFDGYHTFGVSWRPDSIEWYYDGKQILSAPTPADMHQPFYMIANLAVGGNWPGAPDGATAFPAEMKIDYIKAWQYADLM